MSGVEGAPDCDALPRHLICRRIESYYKKQSLTTNHLPDHSLQASHRFSLYLVPIPVVRLCHLLDGTDTQYTPPDMKFLITIFPTVAMAALTSISQNDVTNGGGCKAMTVLFARGTTEPGNMGIIAGPPFVSALGKMMGASNLAVQGIEYPADIPGFLVGGDAGGSKLMAQMVGQVRAKCPDTTLVMAGYS